MTRTALVTALAAWVPSALAVGPGQRLDVTRRVRIPGAGPIDLLTVRHAGDDFAVGLWSIAAQAVGDGEIDGMTRRVLAFDAWYADFREQAELLGFRPLHRITVTGNVVGRSVRRGPMVDLLSNRGSAVRFWTWKRSAGGIEFSPVFGNSRVLAHSRSRLKALLTHLTWEDAGELSEETPVRAVRP